MNFRNKISFPADFVLSHLTETDDSFLQVWGRQRFNVFKVISKLTDIKIKAEFRRKIRLLCPWIVSSKSGEFFLMWVQLTVHKALNYALCVCVCVHTQLCLTLQHHQLLYPWNFPDKNTGVVCHFLFQGIFLTQGSNLCLLHLLHGRQVLYQLSHHYG